MSTELTKSAGQERPAFLTTNTPVLGTEGMAEKVRPSFMKIVQKQSSDQLIELFGSGSIILTPDNELVCKADEVVSFVCLFHFTEFCKWAPIALKGTEPMIADRSFDPKSTIAIKSQSPSTWAEDHPNYPGSEKHQYKYREHLNFIIKLLDPEHAHREPVLISFSKTNYSVGQRLLKLILQRRASIFAGRYQIGVRMREGQENQWRVYTVDIDREASWVADETEFKLYEDAFSYYKDLHKKRELASDYDADEDSEEAVVVDADEEGSDEVPY